MKVNYSLFILLLVGLTSCQNQQWEDRVARGDTGSVAHDVQHPMDSFSCDKNSRGKILFTENCVMCHCDPQEKQCEQSLENILDRIPGGNWKYHFLRKADSLIKSGDGYANVIFLSHNKVIHPRFPNLTNEQIDTILIYANVSRDF